MSNRYAIGHDGRSAEAAARRRQPRAADPRGRWCRSARSTRPRPIRRWRRRARAPRSGRSRCRPFGRASDRRGRSARRRMAGPRRRSPALRRQSGSRRSPPGYADANGGTRRRVLDGVGQRGCAAPRDLARVGRGVSLGTGDLGGDAALAQQAVERRRRSRGPAPAPARARRDAGAERPPRASARRAGRSRPTGRPRRTVPSRSVRHRPARCRRPWPAAAIRARSPGVARSCARSLAARRRSALGLLEPLGHGVEGRRQLGRLRVRPARGPRSEIPAPSRCAACVTRGAGASAGSPARPRR